MIAKFVAHAGRAARRTVVIAAVTATAAVGVSFLTVAAWIGLSDAFGPIVAAIVLGFSYLSASLLIFLIAQRIMRDPPVTGPETGISGLTIATIAEAFIIGMTAARGRKSKE